MTSSRSFMPVPVPTPEQDTSALPQLRALVGSVNGDVVLRLAGEIDLTTTGILAAAVGQCLQDRPARLTIDLREVTFCDCAGVRALRHARQRAIAAGACVRLTALTPPVRRVLTLIEAADLLGAAASESGDSGAAPDGVLVMPPAPPPDAVWAARRQLTEQYAGGVQRLLWEREKHPMPDAEAIRRAIRAVGDGNADSVEPALVLLQAARLGLDRLEAGALDAACAAGVSDEALAAALGLPAAPAAAAWHRWLTARRTLPYDESAPAPRALPGGAADAAARAGRRAIQAADRAGQIARRLEQLSSASGTQRPNSREAAERSAADAGEARVLAAEAVERAALGLLRAAEAMEGCAAGYEQLATADSARSDQYRQEAAWYWHTAQGYRELAGQRCRPGSTQPR